MQMFVTPRTAAVHWSKQYISCVNYCRRTFNVDLICSDGTLNPNGVRFGSAEIYHIG